MARFFAALCLAGTLWRASAGAAAQAPAPTPPPRGNNPLAALGIFTDMPGERRAGPLPPLDEREEALASQLRRDVEKLAGEIGERNVWQRDNQEAAADFILESFRAAGLKAGAHSYEAGDATFRNIEAEIPGSSRAAEILVVCAHYDTVRQGPGANDNASGVAATLALARAFAGQEPARTLRFVCFSNEEMTGPREPWMGSLHYAARCREREERIVGAMNIDTIGCFSDEPGSQRYPPPFNQFYPTTANFIAVVGDTPSKDFVLEIVETFRRVQALPCEGLAAPRSFPDIGRSDHASFWAEGYPGAMITDTANFRDEHYHQPTDTADKIDFDRTARVVAGLEKVLDALANPANAADNGSANSQP